MLGWARGTVESIELKLEDGLTGAKVLLGEFERVEKLVKDKNIPAEEFSNEL